VGVGVGRWMGRTNFFKANHFCWKNESWNRDI
jgi:hypothetical protein